MRKEFVKAFGLSDTLEAEEKRFVNRIDQTTFRRLAMSHDYEATFRRVCYEMGISADEKIRKFSDHAFPPLRKLTDDGFIATLEVLGHIYRGEYESKQSRLDSEISDAMQRATIDLGIEWRHGMFFPTGAGVLNEDLAIGAYEFLNEYPPEKAAFRKALEHHLRRQYPDVLGEGYIVIEGLAKRLLNNDKTLDGNREALVSALGLAEEWKHLVKYYLDYAHAGKRHASKEPRVAKPHEAEAFLYLTGLMVRLIVQDLRNRPAKSA